MDEQHSQKYKDHLLSLAWSMLRGEAMARANRQCERCMAVGVALEVHHKHYRTLGHESLLDVEVLCIPCHDKADNERRVAVRQDSSRRLYHARLNGWASKKYGEDWSAYGDADEIAEEFNEWLEGRDD